MTRLSARFPTLVLLLAWHANLMDGALAIDVGAAREDITPDYAIRLGGYLARSAESRGVSQRIWAKALAIGTDEQKPAILVTVDNLGVSDEIVTEVASRLLRRSGVERSAFVVCSSHTHSAPCLTNVAPNIFGKKIVDHEQRTIDRYTRELTDKLEQVALSALKNRKPGGLAWGQGKVDFASNRRTPGGPVDHSLPFLKAVDADGRIIAIVVNYACHCTTLDPRDNTIAGDWAGHAQEEIEKDHPGAIALTTIGCGADANPRRREGPNAADAARSYGRMIADEVRRRLSESLTPMIAPPERMFKRVDLPFDKLPTREELTELIKKGGPPGYNAAVQLAKLDRGEPLQSHVSYPVQTWSFDGGPRMVFLSGEVVVDYVSRLKRELNDNKLWVSAYANDVPCYIPSERILREGGYEGGGAMVYFSRPTRFKPGIEAIIINAVESLISEESIRKNLPPANTPRAKSPGESLNMLRVKPGLRAELVAAEPLIRSPVAIDWGIDGKLWVCEMRDYPTGIDGRWKPGGAVVSLEDSDGDGVYDKSAEFISGLPFPTGVLAWDKGVLICAAPEIIYAEDSDGDGRADIRNVLFRGFATENYQARVNGLSYGLDNLIHGANGLIGGVIKGTASGRSVDIGGRDFLFDPDSGRFEPAAGLSQQGRIRDDWNNAFGNNNSIMLQHYPFPDRYSRRNRSVAAPSPSIIVANDSDANKLFPTSRTVERYNHPESANYVTSACGPCIYRDDLLGQAYSGNAFVCEPVHNLVTRLVLEPNGVVFEGKRAKDEKTSEFLSSEDHWFRPVQARTGPDGALYVVDMYRHVIEHPRWISPDGLAGLDVRAGHDLGRIYRIVPEQTPPRAVPRLDSLGSEDLARLIDSPNGTLRDNIQRALVKLGDRKSIPILDSIATSGKYPQARVQALWTLEALKSLKPETLAAALLDAEPRVRAQAVRLSEPRLGKSESIGNTVLRAVVDPDPRVRFQVALSLGEWDDPRVAQPLARLAGSDASNPWIVAAVLSSSSKRPGEILAAVMNGESDHPSIGGVVTSLLATVIGKGDQGQLEAIIKRLSGDADRNSDVPWRMEALAELLDSRLSRELIERHGVSLRRDVETAGRLALDETCEAGLRNASIRLLSHFANKDVSKRDIFKALLSPDHSESAGRSAIQALSRVDEAWVADLLLDAWPILGPTLRKQVLDALLDRVTSSAALAKAVASERVEAPSLDSARRRRLLDSAPSPVRRQLEAVFRISSESERRDVVKKYGDEIKSNGDVRQGANVFQKSCATCHRLRGQGAEVGPDLDALTDRSMSAFLAGILDPNREVDARYVGHVAQLQDGRVLQGIIVGESGNAISLKRQDGRVDTVLRSELIELRSTGKSLMPEGLENELSPSAVADLIAFLNTEPDGPKAFAGNRPEPVGQSPTGTIRLTAENAAIHGPTIAFVSKHKNIGMWRTSTDRARWTAIVEKSGVFTVSIDWACPEESAGNRYEIRIGPSTLTGVVGPTGGWDRYRTIFVSEVTIAAGTHRVEMRPVGTPRGALLELKGVTLTPRGYGTPGIPRLP